MPPFNRVICDSKAMVAFRSMDTMPRRIPERSLADQISAGEGIRMHCMLASDWLSVRNGTDEHNAIE